MANHQFNSCSIFAASPKTTINYPRRPSRPSAPLTVDRIELSTGVNPFDRTPSPYRNYRSSSFVRSSNIVPTRSIDQRIITFVRTLKKKKKNEKFILRIFTRILNVSEINCLIFFLRRKFCVKKIIQQKHHKLHENILDNNHSKTRCLAYDSFFFPLHNFEKLVLRWKQIIYLQKESVHKCEMVFFVTGNLRDYKSNRHAIFLFNDKAYFGEVLFRFSELIESWSIHICYIFINTSLNKFGDVNKANCALL